LVMREHEILVICKKPSNLEILSMTRMHLIYKSKHGVCLCGQKIGHCLEDSSSHCPFPVELVTNRAGAGQGQGQGRAWQGRAARAAAVGGRARCHFY
jgi:hypothetical protein